jgi:NAD(P)-dependent dehydrogenase (short-subunit alcohol dehydrogenase family)
MTISKEQGSRTVLISGASKGIGRALAERLTGQGHKVVGIARTPDATFPGRLYAADLSDRAATSKALQEISSDNRIDAVVNNVGLVRPQSLEDVSLGVLDAVLDLNLRTAIQLAQAAVPAMRAQGWGRVVNIASLVALGAPQHRTAYAAAKGALISATRVWALELATSGVTVNAVAPGPVETELFRENNPPGSEGEIRYRAMVPMGRLGRPGDIAAAIAFLLSEEASFITGQTIFVDGGASIGRQLI